MEGYQWGGVAGKWGKGTGNKKHNWQAQNSWGRGLVKNSIGNGKAKEFICMTRGHELRGGMAGENEGTGWRGQKGKCNNCNSIINKIYLIKFRKQVYNTEMQANVENRCW